MSSKNCTKESAVTTAEVPSITTAVLHSWQLSWRSALFIVAVAQSLESEKRVGESVVGSSVGKEEGTSEGLGVIGNMVGSEEVGKRDGLEDSTGIAGLEITVGDSEGGGWVLFEASFGCPLLL